MDLRIERTGEIERVSRKLHLLQIEYMRIQAHNPEDPRLDRIKIEMTVLKRSLILLDYERDGREPPKLLQRAPDPE